MKGYRCRTKCVGGLWGSAGRGLADLPAFLAKEPRIGRRVVGDGLWCEAFQRLILLFLLLSRGCAHKL